MKAIRVLLVLVTIAALAFGLTATSRLGALEAQVADLTSQLDTAREDLALSEQITQAFEKERATLQDTIDKLEAQAQPPAPIDATAPEEEPPAPIDATAPEEEPPAPIDAAAPEEEPPADGDVS